MRFIFCIILSWISFYLVSSTSDDSPGFFLKITKNVPRLGRRSGNDYFMKNMKIIPRIGRSESGKTTDSSHIEFSPDEMPLTGFSKRMLINSANAAAAAERGYSVVQPVNSNTLIELLDRHAIPSENVKFVHWKDFDRALQMDADLYGKVISLGRNPDQHLKEDLNYFGGNFVPIFGSENHDDYFMPKTGGGGGVRNDEALENYEHGYLRYNNLK